MIRIVTPLFAVLIFFGLSAEVFAQKVKSAGTKRKIVKYREHTELDFAGQTVQGKIRAPEVFYIFQRKKAKGHNVLRTPQALDHHRKKTVQTLREDLPK